jgi:hypothetical protein
MCDQLPTSVRYVKNGAGGQWWHAALANGQVHLGWDNIQHHLLLNPDFVQIEQVVRESYGPRQGAGRDFNALRTLLDAPSQHIWVAFEDGCMWWCTVHDGVTVNPVGETNEMGHFWLNCNRPWSNMSIGGRPFTFANLPGNVAAVAGFMGVVAKPQAWESILRLINDETDPDAAKAAKARHDYEIAVNKVVQRLPWKDFEHLIDLILARSGWDRISTLGGTLKGIDLEAENPTTGEIAFVQVKGRATQEILNGYVEQFKRQRGHYARMIFAVHTPEETLAAPIDIPVHLWTGERIAELVVLVGLGKWVENRLA